MIKPVIDEFKHYNNFKTQLIVTGAHLSKAHGYTVEEIKNDGLEISAEIDMLSNDDTPRAITKSIGREFTGLAHSLDKLKPNLMVIAGDRYEMLAAASACLVARIPIAHIYGGDITEGAFDDAIRHAITKMSHLHFVSNEESRRRVIQMGEQPEHVFNVGSPSLDKIKSLKYLSREELAENLKIKFRKYNLLVTFHPETLSPLPIEAQIAEFTGALRELGDEFVVFITMPNADPDGEKIRNALQSFVKDKENFCLFESLGYSRYFSLMNNVTAVIGNSSSGIYEAPSFKIPTVNIGNRQHGRLMAKSVINCAIDKDEILKSIETAKSLNCEKVKNPYDGGNASKKIVEAISKTQLGSKLLIKKFHDIHNS